MKALSIIVLALMFSACSSLPKMSAVAPTICSFATSTESQNAAQALINKMPDGKNRQYAQLALQISEVSADAGCTAIKVVEAQHAAQSQPVAPAGQ